LRYLVLVLPPVVSLFLETSFFVHYPIVGSGPDLILLFVTFFALLNGSNKGLVYGMACGLFRDLYLGRAIGVSAVALALTGYLLGKWEFKVFQDNYMVGLFAALAATTLNSTCLLALLFVSTGDIYVAKSVGMQFVGQVIYNGVLSIPLYVWYYKASRQSRVTIRF